MIYYFDRSLISVNDIAKKRNFKNVTFFKQQLRIDSKYIQFTDELVKNRIKFSLRNLKTLFLRES